MKITFESSPKRFNFPFRIIGSAGRYDTISDCEFLDDSHIVCADRQMARLYLIEFSFETGSYSILDTIECVFEGKSFNFELLYICENIVYGVAYKTALLSCSIVNNKFVNMKFVTISKGEAYHGICGAGKDSVYLTNMLRPSITKYNVKTNETSSIACDGGTRMKDAVVIDDRCLLALSSDSGPINGTLGSDGKVVPHNNPYDSHLLIYERNGRLVRRHVLEKTQIDGCVYANGFLFVTCTDAVGGGSLLRCRIDPEYNFKDIVHIPCAGFPHGVAVRGSLFAYTSYSESALYIGRISEDGSLSEL